MQGKPLHHVLSIELLTSILAGFFSPVKSNSFHKNGQIFKHLNDPTERRTKQIVSIDAVLARGKGSCARAHNASSIITVKKQAVLDRAFESLI